MKSSKPNYWTFFLPYSQETMKKTLTLLFLILIYNIGNSQTTKVSGAEITVGKPYEVIDFWFAKFEIQKANKLIIFKNTMKGLKMQLLDVKTLEQISSKDVKDLPEGFIIEGVKAIKQKYFLIYSLYDKNTNNEQLFSREIDFDNFSFKGTDNLLLKVKDKVTDCMGREIKIGNFVVMQKFNLQLSYDSTKFLVQYRKQPKDKKEKSNHDIIGLFVFSNNLLPISGKEFTMPYSERQMDNIDYSIDSQGNVYTLTTVFDKEDDKTKDYKDGKVNYQLELLIVENKSTEFKISKVNLGDNYINNLQLYETADKKMIGAGFYIEGKNIKYSSNYGDATGIFIFKTDKNGEVKDITTYKIPLEVINQYTSKKNQAKNEKDDKKSQAEFKDLLLKNLILQNDGSIILIGEQSYRNEVTNRNNTGSYVNYFYDNILITKINQNGQLAWMKKLPKHQKGSLNTNWLSYRYINSGDNLYLIYVDNVKNNSLTLDQDAEEYIESGDGFLTAFKVANSNGAISKISLFDCKKLNNLKLGNFILDRIRQTGKNQFIIELYKKDKEDVLIQVKFDNKK